MVEKPIYEEFEQIVDKKYQIEDLINLDDLRKIVEDFHKIAPFPVAVLNLKGEVLLESHWEPICTQFHRVNPKTAAICTESDTHFNAELVKSDERHILYRCGNGLYDAASPILIKGKHLGNFFIGQFLLEPPDEGFFRRQAQRYGFQEEEYLKTLSRVPIISELDLKNRLDYLCGFAEFLGNIGLKEFQRDRAEEALRESKEKYRMLAENATDVIWTMDMNLKLTYISPSILQLRGYTVDEVMVQPLDCMIAPESLGEIMTLLTQKLKMIEAGHEEGWASIVFEMEQPCKDGATIWTLNNAKILQDSEKQPVGIIGVTHNITERKNAEEALRESEVRHRELVENAVLGIFQVTKKGQFLMANERMANIFGYDSRQDFIANADNITKLYIKPEERPIILKKIDEKGHIDGLTMNFRGKNGNPIFCNAYVRSIQRDGGEYIYEGLLEDVTDKRKMEAQLEKAQKMEAMGTLAGGVAHDLNNILGGLVSYPELLLIQLPEDSPLRKPILTIQKSGEKAAAVVQDLLTLARRGVVVTDVVNLNDVIVEYLESPEHKKLQSYHPGTHIETHLEKDVLNILGSSIHLSTTVMNLVSNAVEAVPEGGAITICTENRYIDRPIRDYDDVMEGDYMVLTVSDTGTGISPNDIGKIFEPFYTKKKMGRSGTGLGMAVVWGTVKDHNGYIDVQSSEGKGTTFTLYFPATRKKLSEDETPLSVESYRGNRESILVIDDVEEQRKIATDMLMELGYLVVSVSSGEEAVDYLKTNKADLILLDMIMDPGMNGLDTYKKILEIYPGQKAIIASGFSETDHVKEVQSLGAGAYIRKPLLLEKIGIAVKEELEK